MQQEPVEGTGDSIRATGSMTREAGWETLGARTHVVRVRHLISTECTMYISLYTGVIIFDAIYRAATGVW